MWWGSEKEKGLEGLKKGALNFFEATCKQINILPSYQQAEGEIFWHVLAFCTAQLMVHLTWCECFPETFL